jgi:hypothetical protein
MALLLSPGTAAPAGPDDPAGGAEWIEVDYSELVDRRQPTHSGASVGALLDELGGRGLPATAGGREDRVRHGLLDPLLEPYAYVLPDLIDSLAPVRDPPWVDVGGLWGPGEAQPAWAELLRARHYVVESDGAGNLRAFLPAAGDAADSRGAAQAAWAAAWPVLRHVVAAEQRRLAGREDGPTMVAVDAYAYAHARERSTFRLGVRPASLDVPDTRPDGRRPPLGLQHVQTFLDAGLTLEGARIDERGELHLLGSKAGEPPALLGRPLALADLAVAFRAAFHGGLGEPYMSLDRGTSPQTFLVNYGGRLRDTALGRVSLLCDIRFKTFSVGLDIERGEDLRRTLREGLEEFWTHLERFARHPDSRQLAGQQTRLWFYPDAVDLTLSPQGDVFVMRRVRMSAASERMQEGGLHAQEAAEHPWTLATVDAINRDYEALAGFFPEMADLDQVVRLLSLFAWLRQAEADGLLLPELDALLAVELPQLATPRTYPQLLAFNALPPPGSAEPVEVFDRVDVAEALDRLAPEGGRPLPPGQRYRRAVASLDPQQPDHAAVLAELARQDVEGLGGDDLDLLAHGAERVRMHHLVLATLGGEARRRVVERMRSGEELRIFSVGIGGLDLDMGQALARARAGQAGAQAEPGGRPAAGREPRETWRTDSDELPRTVLPDHGLGGPSGARGARAQHGDRIVEVQRPAAAAGRSGRILTVDGAFGPEVRSRRLDLDARGRAVAIERVEPGGGRRYRFESSGGSWTARLEESPAPARAPGGDSPAALPEGLATLRVVAPDAAPVESLDVGLQLARDAGGTVRTMEARFPRATLQRLVLGREADLTPGQPLGGLAPLPPALGDVAAMMVLPDGVRWLPPWEAVPPLVPGEEDPLRLARALREWWGGADGPAPAAVVGVDAGRSPARWHAAPRPGRGSLLLLPSGAFAGSAGELRAGLAAAWKPGRVVEELPASIEGALVVLVSDEPPATFGERLHVLSGDARLDGKLLAAWCLSGPVRADLPGALLAAGRLAGVGLAEASVVLQRRTVEEVAELRRGLAAENDRAERLPGPFLWYF